MKELSIEEKARAYDEAIERARKLHENSNGTILKKWLWNIFPELKESEDEKVRKWLISYFKYVCDNVSEKEKKGILTWLEKQNSNVDNANKEYWRGYREGKQEILDKYAKLEKQGEKSADTDNKFTGMRETKPKDISEFLDRLTTVEQEFLWEHIAKIRELDKQEQKDILEDAILDSNEDGLIAETIRYKNEKKLVDKVEPKFKVGDWVICCDYEPIQITDIDIKNRMYYWSNGDIRPIEMVDSNSNIHLWTIQDAKDGDVLYMDNGLSTCTFIYKSINNVIIQKYASYNKFGFEGTTYLVLNDGYVCPATKEQRDTLLKAMADAGYTFDFDKKELKNIEQKSAGWHREDEQNLNACLGYIRDEFLRRWLIDVIHSKYDKPSWSEEDEDMRYKAKAVINRLCAEGKEYVWSVKTLKKLFYWLNSLKDRVQPKQEWSEEEIEKAAQEWDSKANFNPFYMIMDGDKPTDVKQDITTHKESFKAGVNWILKSLRPQSQWKPSEEQISLLQAIVNDPNNAASESCQIALKEVIRQLKKLMDE